MRKVIVLKKEINRKEVQEWVKEAKEVEEVGVAAKAVELIREWVEQYNWTVGA